MSINQEVEALALIITERHGAGTVEAIYKQENCCGSLLAKCTALSKAVLGKINIPKVAATAAPPASTAPAAKTAPAPAGKPVTRTQSVLPAATPRGETPRTNAGEKAAVKPDATAHRSGLEKYQEAIAEQLRRDHPKTFRNK